MKKRWLLFLAVIIAAIIIAAIVVVIIPKKFSDDSESRIEEEEFEDMEEDEVELAFYTLEPYTFEPWEFEPEDLLEGEPAPPELAEYVNSAGRDIVKFLNKTYDMDWQYRDVEIYTLAETESFGGCYLPTYKTLYLNTNFVYGNANDVDLYPGVKFIIFHELIHAITDQNRGTPFFYKWYSEKDVLGGYVHEGLTELLTEEYAESKGIKLKDVYPNGMSSGYIHIVYYLRATEVAFEGAIRDILTDNMSELETRMEKKAENDEAFDKWLFLLDITQMQYLRDHVEYDHEEYNSFIYVETMTEFLISVTDDPDALLDEINIYFDKSYGTYSGTQYCEDLIDALDQMHFLSENKNRAN